MISISKSTTVFSASSQSYMEVESGYTKLIDLYVDRPEGEVTVECDRCLGDLRLPVNYTGDLTVKFSDETEDYDGEVMWLNPAEEKVPLAQYIYESIVLSLPYRKVHGTGPDGEPLCDKEMLARFRIISQAEFDALETEQHSLADTDEGGKLQQLMQELEKGEDKE